MRLPVLILAAVLTAAAAPSFAQGAPPPTGGALALPAFDLTAALAPLPAQLSAHQARLAEAQAAPTGDPTAQVLVNQLQMRIRLLQLFLDPLPVFDPAAPGAELQQQLTENQAALERYRRAVEEAKGSLLSPRDVGAIDARIAELTDRVARLTELTTTPTPPTPPTAPQNPPATPPPAGPTPPPANPPPAEPTPPATPPPAEPAPTPPAPPVEPVRVTLGDLMSSITRIAAELDTIRALPQPVRPDAIQIVRVSELVQGNGQGLQQAMNRAYFADLHAYLNGEPVFRDALAAAAVPVDQVVAVKVFPNGVVVIFAGG